VENLIYEEKLNINWNFMFIKFSFLFIIRKTVIMYHTRLLCRKIIPWDGISGLPFRQCSRSIFCKEKPSMSHHAMIFPHNSLVYNHNLWNFKVINIFMNENIIIETYRYNMTRKLYKVQYFQFGMSKFHILYKWIIRVLSALCQHFHVLGPFNISNASIS
jgi:hypothetical protein